MKRLPIFLLVMLLAMPVMAKQIKVQFEWQANTETTMAGYGLFRREEGQAYDYDAPIDPDCTIVDGACYVDPTAKTCTFTDTFDAPDGKATTYYWVARARDTDGDWSEDSNEVTMTVDLAPIVAAVITNGSYDSTTKNINIAFSQTDVNRADHWELYMGTASGGPYNKVDTLANDNSGDTFSIDHQITADGTYYFTIVTFTKEGVFSPNSNEMSVEVKEHPAPTKDFKIKIRIQ